MDTAADNTALAGLAPVLPRTERLRRTLDALRAAALTLIGIHAH
jgi:hypothetical protein